MAKEYFPHDYNSRNKLKMAAMIHEFGTRGYGLFWMIVEILHEEESHWLELKPYTYISLAQQTKEEVEFLEVFISKCLQNYEVFIEKDGKFTTERVLKNVDKRQEIREKRSKAGKASAHAKHLSTHVEQNSTNKIKENKKKVNKIYELGEVGPFGNDALNNEWRKWLQYRREIKKPVTLTAAEEQISFLQKHEPETAILIISKSITNGWQGLFEIKEGNRLSGNSKAEPVLKYGFL